MNLPEKIYTETDVTKARSRGKAVGWIQGGGVVLGGAIVWNLLGWIPVLIGIVAVGWVILKLMGRGKKDEEATE